jgi:hypothetical protein
MATIRPGNQSALFVDDGCCPAGEVKQVTGDHKAKTIPREVKCAPKPQ